MKFSKEILSLPINPYMTENEVNFVIKKVNEFFKDGRGDLNFLPAPVGPTV